MLNPSDRTGQSYETVLFGHDATERIVAVEPGETFLRLWKRGEDGSVETFTEPLRPWLLAREPLPSLPGEAIELHGDGYRFLYEFESLRAYNEARFALRANHRDILAYANPTKMALTRNGKTLFKGMSLTDIVRMQIDIETEGLESETDRLLMIAIGDNRGHLEAIVGTEPEMLDQLVERVQRLDPDVIEGHNLYGFDLPFLVARAAKHQRKLRIGRGGVEIRAGQERNFAIGGISRPFTQYYVYGRHLIDTYLAVQRYDWAKGSLARYGLKEVARAFGIAEADRVEVPRDQMVRLYAEDPARIETYALQDIVETRRLAELVTPTEFYATQMAPDSYGAAAVGGTGEKINALMVRTYLAAGYAIPAPTSPISTQGGYTDLRIAGVIRRVVKADVESLYPSIMLAERIAPESDTLGIFLPALAELTRRRFEAKARSRSEAGAEARYWDGLQNSFKILINSFYGYLGANTFNFNDYHAANRITRAGRDLVQKIAAQLETTGSRVIEIDTDGVYLSPPVDVDGEEEERQYVARIGAILPEGIRLAFDGRYEAMLSIKTKNYVLLEYDGRRVYKGASMRSRADERYGREFLESAIDLLFANDLAGIGELYARTIEELWMRRVPIEALARRERVTRKTFHSANKARSAEVARETSVGDYLDVYERANGRLGLLEEYEQNGCDENAAYYMEKLYKFAGRLRDAFAGEFDALIPRPTAQGLPAKLQTSLNLFD